jgi:hypothetical protein
MESFIAELVKQGGGYLLAGLAIYVIKYMADQRITELNAHMAEKDADRKTLLTAVSDAAAAISRAADSNASVVMALSTMQSESRARTTEILQSIEMMKVTLAEHVALAATTADAAKQAAVAAQIASDAAKVASDSAAVVASSISRRQIAAMAKEKKAEKEKP